MLVVFFVPLVLLFAGQGVDSQGARNYQPAALGARHPPPFPPYAPAYPPGPFPRPYLRRQPLAAPFPPPLPPRIVYRLPPPRPAAPLRQPFIVESAECGSPTLGGECCKSEFFCLGPQIEEEHHRCDHLGPANVCCTNGMCDA